MESNQRVDDDPALISPDKGDIGEIKTANLVNTWDDLVQAIVHVQGALALQRGVDAVELLARELFAEILLEKVDKKDFVAGADITEKSRDYARTLLREAESTALH